MKRFDRLMLAFYIIIALIVITIIAMAVVAVVGENASNYYNHVSSTVLYILGAVMVLECVGVVIVYILIQHDIYGERPWD